MSTTVTTSFLDLVLGRFVVGGFILLDFGF